LEMNVLSRPLFPLKKPLTGSGLPVYLRELEIPKPVGALMYAVAWATSTINGRRTSADLFTAPVSD
jgi:hypothetical protein